MKSRSHQLLKILLIIIPLILGGVFLWVLFDHSDSDNRNTSQKIAELIERSEQLSEENPDSAIMIYTMLANMYRPSMSREEKEMIIRSQAEKGRLCFFRKNDYVECYRAASAALEMMNESGIENTDIHINIGNLFHTISEECNDTSLMRDSFHHNRVAYVAVKEKEHEKIDMLLTNLIFEAQMIDSLEVMEPEMREYEALDSQSPSTKSYNILLYRALIESKAGKHDSAISTMDSVVKIYSPEDDIRAYMLAVFVRSRMLYDFGRYDETIANLDSALVLAKQYNMKDALIEVYAGLGDSWKAKGDQLNANLWKNRYHELRDTLVGYQPLVQINNIKADRDLARIEAKMIREENERRIQKITILVFVGVLLILSIFTYVLIKRNRRLKQTNRSLYNRNVEGLEREKEEGLLRRNYETRLKVLQNNLELTRAELEILRKEKVSGQEKIDEFQPEDMVVEFGIERLSAAENIADYPEYERYKGSGLDEERKMTLLNTILNTMEETEEYMSPDFSVKRLADLIGCSYKSVSQVINEKCEQNFNKFVNNYRIDEACRMIADVERYGSLTLDAISNKVGFRARSSFISAFRQKTGMTPSQYQKIARSEYTDRLKK